LMFAVVFLLVPLGIVIWGLVDASSHPAWAWDQARQNKTLWIVLQAVGVLFCFVGVILSIVYLAAIAPQVRAAERAFDLSSGPPGGPPPGWYPDPNWPGRVGYWDGIQWTGQVR